MVYFAAADFPAGWWVLANILGFVIAYYVIWNDLRWILYEALEGMKVYLPTIMRR